MSRESGRSVSIRAQNLNNNLKERIGKQPMIQDIFPAKFHNSFMAYALQETDNLLFFNDEGKMLIREEEGKLIFTTGAQIGTRKAVYLFSIDERRYFLVLDCTDHQQEGFAYYSVRELRALSGGKELFAAFTAYHLWKWYADNRYCGKCAHRLQPDRQERALRCPHCDQVIYPRINPAVIVGVVKEDCLLITRYRRGYAHNALVAGFTEIGETLEETVEREVMEETGVRVKNIRYYKSQPWGMTQDILVGFFCEAEGDGEIHMDQNELKYAEWVKREEITLQPNHLSLTNEMMQVFREKKEK